METTWKSHTAKSFPRRLSVLLDDESIGAVRHCGLSNNEIAVSLYYRKLPHGEDEMYDGVCFVDYPALQVCAMELLFSQTHHQASHTPHTCTYPHLTSQCHVLVQCVRPCGDVGPLALGGNAGRAGHNQAFRPTPCGGGREGPGRSCC